MASGDTSSFERAVRGFFSRNERYDGLGPTMGRLIEVMDTLHSFVKPFSEVQSAAAELARTLGLAGSNIMQVSKMLVAQNKDAQLSLQYGVSGKEILNLQTKLMSSTARNVGIDNAVRYGKNGEIISLNQDSELENLIAASTVFGDETVAEIVAGFDKIGKNMKSAAKVTGKLFKEAGEYGINLQAYTKNFTSNLQMVQNYNFRNGINGLREMARKATEIRQDMSQVAAFADKVGTVTGAVETAANLQVLGGAFTQMANPLAMLNESLTDMEGLQQRIINMTKGAAHYNPVTHQIGMDPLTRMRLKAAAQAAGLDSNNLIDQAYAQSRREEIKSQMNGFGNFREDVEKLLPNVGTIDEETGLAGAMVNGNFVSLGELSRSEDLQKQLVEESRSESEDIKEIAKSVMDIRQVISGKEYALQNEAALNSIKPGIVGGVSTWENVADTIATTINGRLISALGKADFISEFSKSLRASLMGVGNELMQVIDANSVDEFVGTFKEKMDNVVGEGPVSSFVSGLVEQVAPTFSNFTKDIDNFTQGVADFSIYARTLASTESLNPGNGTNFTSPGVSSDTEQTSQTVARSSTSHTDLENSGFVPPIAGQQTTQGQYEPKARSNDEQVSAVRKPLVLEPLSGFDFKAQIAQPKETLSFTRNSSSIPTQTVVNHQAQTSVQGESDSVQNVPNAFTINLSGTLTMNVNGDNGKIGTIDIVKMFRENPSLLKEVSEMIGNEIKDIANHTRL